MTAKRYLQLFSYLSFFSLNIISLIQPPFFSILMNFLDPVCKIQPCSLLKVFTHWPFLMRAEAYLQTSGPPLWFTATVHILYKQLWAIWKGKKTSLKCNFKNGPYWQASTQVSCVLPASLSMWDFIWLSSRVIAALITNNFEEQVIKATACLGSYTKDKQFLFSP